MAPLARLSPRYAALRGAQSDYGFMYKRTKEDELDRFVRFVLSFT